MVIWSGWGILVVVFLFVGLIIGVPVGDLVSTDPDTRLGVSLIIAGLVGGLGAFFLARKLEGGEGRAFIDEATGQRIVVRRSAGSLFFIPTRYWAYVAPVLGIVLAAVMMASPSTPAGEPETMTIAPDEAPVAPVA